MLGFFTVKAFFRLSFLFVILFLVGAVVTAAAAAVMAWLRLGGVGPLLSFIGSGIQAAGSDAPGIVAVAAIVGFAYSDRHAFSTIATSASLFLFSFLFLLGVSMGMARLAPQFGTPEPAMAAPESRIPGLIVDGEGGQSVALGDSAGGAQVSLVTKAEGVAVFSVRSGPPEEELSPYGRLIPDHPSLKAFARDVAGTASRFDEAGAVSLFQLAALIGAFVFLLASLRPIAGVSAWPLVNVTLAAAAMRGVFVVEALVASSTVRKALVGAFGGIPFPYIEAAILGAVALLIILASLAGWAAGTKGSLRA